MSDVANLIEALRTKPAKATTTIYSGHPAGQPRVVEKDEDNGGKYPLEQRREGYRLYAQEARQNDEDPETYEQWFAKQE